MLLPTTRPLLLPLLLVGVLCAPLANGRTEETVKYEWVEKEGPMLSCPRGNTHWEVTVEPKTRYTFKTSALFGKGSKCGVRFNVEKCLSGVTVVTKKLNFKTKTSCYKRFLQDTKKDKKKNSMISVCGVLAYDGSKDKPPKDKKVGMMDIDDKSKTYEGYFENFQLVFKNYRKQKLDKDSFIEQEIFCKEGKEVVEGDCKCGSGEPLHKDDPEDRRLKRSTRVINGVASVVYPWMAAVIIDDDEDFMLLSGTLISDSAIIVADSPAFDDSDPKSNLAVQLAGDEVPPTVVSVTEAKHGLRLIIIEKLDFEDSDARPVCLPKADQADKYLITDKATYVMTYGHGVNNPTEFKIPDLPQLIFLKSVKNVPGRSSKAKNTKAFDRCKKAYGGLESYQGCAMRKPTKQQYDDGIKRIGLCWGDVGAPLLVPENGSKMKPTYKFDKTLTIVGVVTDFAAIEAGDDVEDLVENGICGHPKSPSRYTRLDKTMLDWITSKITDLKTCPAAEWTKAE